MGDKLIREQVEQIVKSAREKDERPNLRGADLSEAYFIGANLKVANLREANPYKADLRG